MPETPALSPYIAHAIVTECPLQAWAEHRLLGNCIKISDQALALRERGSAIHSLVLEDGEKIVALEHDSYRSKAAQAERDETRAAKKIPILAKDMGPLHDLSGRIFSMLDGLGYGIAEGLAERKIQWQETSPMGSVLCSGIPDWVSPDATRWVDLKTTTASVHPDACAAAMVRGAAVIQDSAYTSAMEILHPENTGRVSGIFLFAQSVPPFALTPVYCAGSMRQLGESRWQHAIALWEQCLANDNWPSHADQPIPLEAPPWAVAKAMELEERNA